jgi:hypothetical protein
MATKWQHQQQIAMKGENQSSVFATNIRYNEFAVLIIIFLPMELPIHIDRSSIFCRFIYLVHVFRTA